MENDWKELKSSHITDGINKIFYEAHPLQFELRLDGRLEWVCNHGTGHTVAIPKKYQEQKSWWTHGCDGCCKEMR